VYYGWAGLSPSKATQAHPPHSNPKYNLVPAELRDELTGLASNSQAGDDERGSVYPMVMSIGWNPFYKNTVRSVEVHVMHDFETDFYGSHMNLIILGYIRPELDYVSKEKLIEDIKTDIEVAGRSLVRAPYAAYRQDKYLTDFEGRGEVAH
jgi:riboflavin kinase